MQVDPVAYARWCSLSASKARTYANWFAGKRNLDRPPCTGCNRVNNESGEGVRGASRILSRLGGAAS